MLKPVFFPLFWSVLLPILAPGLPDMKRKHAKQRAAAMIAATKQTGLTEINST